MPASAARLRLRQRIPDAQSSRHRHAAEKLGVSARRGERPADQDPHRSGGAADADRHGGRADGDQPPPRRAASRRRGDVLRLPGQRGDSRGRRLPPLAGAVRRGRSGVRAVLPAAVVLAFPAGIPPRRPGCRPQPRFHGLRSPALARRRVDALPRAIPAIRALPPRSGRGTGGSRGGRAGDGDQRDQQRFGQVPRFVRQVRRSRAIRRRRTRVGSTLEEQLVEAVRAEDYELAARLRDQIRDRAQPGGPVAP